MKKRIEHIIKYESRVKSFVKGAFDERRILEDCAKIHSKTNKNLPLKNVLIGVKVLGDSIFGGEYCKLVDE